ncbi:hypothetical protein LCGC14_1009040 [marine sediment metagenome]|uniref:Uncharacterized protein n=1 Tax=marine sediment metagenome TaxID=412755 RepID=A0A0F9QJ37_9ZZZZ
MGDLTGRIVLHEEVTSIVDDVKIILGIHLDNMSESVKKICEITIELRNDIQDIVEIYNNFIEKHCPRFKHSTQMLQINNKYNKYFPSERKGKSKN